MSSSHFMVTILGILALETHSFGIFLLFSFKMFYSVGSNESVSDICHILLTMARKEETS